MRCSNSSRVGVATLLSLLLTSWSVAAADRDTLMGLKEVQVSIEDVSPEAERDGLSVTQIRSDVESQLRDGGLGISSDAIERFYVNINAHPTGFNDGRYVFNIEARLSQPVVLLRTNAVFVSGTWSRATVGTTPVGALPMTVGADLRDLIRAFLVDYSASNSK